MFFSFQCSDICPRRKPVITNEKRKTKSIVNYYNKENPINEAKFAWFNLFLSHKEYFCIVSQADRVVAKEAHSLFLFALRNYPRERRARKIPRGKFPVSHFSVQFLLRYEAEMNDEEWLTYALHARMHDGMYAVFASGWLARWSSVYLIMSIYWNTVNTDLCCTYHQQRKFSRNSILLLLLVFIHANKNKT